MFIPIGTDAPLKHLPIVTGILIVINIVCFVLQHFNSDPQHSQAIPPNVTLVAASMQQGFDEFNLEDKEQKKDRNWDSGQVDIEDWDDLKGDDEDDQVVRELIRALSFEKERGWRKHTLWIGDGLHPTQWLTSFFLHGDILHLLGNMIFLALFGVIVEGRMGNWQFAVYYLAVGLTGSLITQWLLLEANRTICLGASGAIYGIMVTASVWSPKVNINCMLIYWLRPFFIHIPLLIFAAAYVLMDLGVALFTERLVNTPLLHVLGASAGAIVSFVVLRMHWVDTEYQDIVSLFIEATGKDPKKVNKRPLSRKEIEQKETDRQERKSTREEKLERIWRSVDAHLAANNLDAAISMGGKGVMMDPKSGWEEERLLRLIGKLQVEKLWKEVVRFSELYLERYNERELAIRINLAKIYVVQKQLPRRALKTIAPLESVPVTKAQSVTVRKIVSEAQKLIDEGVLEIGE